MANGTDILMGLTELAGVFLGLATIAYTRNEFPAELRNKHVASNLAVLMYTNAMIVATCLSGMLIFALQSNENLAWTMVGVSLVFFNLPVANRAYRTLSSIEETRHPAFGQVLVLFSVLFHFTLLFGLVFAYSFGYAKMVVLTAIVLAFGQVLLHFIAIVEVGAANT